MQIERPQRARQPYCDKGHEFTTANTYVNPSTGDRQCRECKRARRTTRYAKQKRIQAERIVNQMLEKYGMTLDKLIAEAVEKP